MTSDALYVVLFLAALCAGAGHAAKIPESWGICHRSDPRIDTCLHGAVQRAFKELVGGSKAWAMYPLDPFRIDKVHMQQGSGNIRIDMGFSEVNILGLKDSTVTGVKSDMDKFKMSIVFDIPKLILLGKYVVQGQILLFPIDGHGDCNVTMERVKLTLDMKGSPVHGKGGKTYFHVDESSTSVVPEHTSFRFVNPDSNHVQQDQLLNRFLNDNDKDVMQELRPAISDAFSQGAQDVCNRVFSRVPLDQLFPQ